MTGNLAPLVLATISVNGKPKALKQPITAECIARRSKGKPQVMFRFRYLRLRGKGRTRPEAAADFDKQLRDLLETLRDEPREPQGIELRDRLLEYVDLDAWEKDLDLPARSLHGGT